MLIGNMCNVCQSMENFINNVKEKILRSFLPFISLLCDTLQTIANTARRFNSSELLLKPVNFEHLGIRLGFFLVCY